jgi:transcriptional regulator with XRE-family HTH domain
VLQQPSEFGEELRRRRLARGLTLAQLTQRVHYSKGHLSKVERGIKVPSRQLARLCDAVLGAEGNLAELAPAKPSGMKAVIGPGDDYGNAEVWRLQNEADAQERLHTVSRRLAMTAGAASIPAMTIGRPGAPAGIADASLIRSFRSLFDQYRRLGQAIDAGLLLPVLAAQTHMLEELTRDAGPQMRRQLLILGSRYAEYVGWLVQETGDERTALTWTRRAVELAAAGGDHDLAAYGLVRQGLVTLYREDAGQTIQLAQRAQANQVRPRIQGLAAQREAQGHALAGDYGACMRSLDRARSLLSRDSPDPDSPVIGSSNLADPVEMIRGWCLHDLGRPRSAAEVIGRQLGQVPKRAVRSQVRYGVRRALACAVAGEVDQACQLTAELLDSALSIRSATVAVDLRKLARSLARHPLNESVRALAPRLGTATAPAIS